MHLGQINFDFDFFNLDIGSSISFLSFFIGSGLGLPKEIVGCFLSFLEALSLSFLRLSLPGMARAKPEYYIIN